MIFHLIILLSFLLIEHLDPDFVLIHNYLEMILHDLKYASYFVYSFDYWNIMLGLVRTLERDVLQRFQKDLMNHQRLQTNC